MNNLIFSLNATLPIFLLMVLGYFFNKIHIIDEKSAAWMNKFVFKIALPVLLFEDLAGQDFAGTWDGKFVGFCFFATISSICIISLIGKLFIKNRSEAGEFIQGSYRSSAALLGIAFIHNIYGEASTGMAPLMIIGSVPLYNIFAVIVLTVTAPKSAILGRYTSENNSDENVKKELVKKTIKGILTNPILIGIFCGLLWSLVRVPMPTIMGKVVNNIGDLATPLGLMSMGATFDYKKAVNKLKPAVTASFIKLFLLVAIFMPLAILIGFRDEQIISLLVMLGSATTVSSFIMSKNMGHEGTLSSSIIMITTFGCSFSLTFWLFVLKSFRLI
ncbi:AEC family transporter [Butyrivibrio sp. YAB3001]|uniref:AEC family transporter n=1 Tax=Butyrivibrio sp. YAB3001 TaxID=1520812 RepID=UPI000B87A5D1|nr:AEC family transporter [Butyrivibrio sp. YAB3001]